jgi:hypothetical protein
MGFGPLLRGCNPPPGAYRLCFLFLRAYMVTSCVSSFFERTSYYHLSTVYITTASAVIIIASNAMFTTLP